MARGFSLLIVSWVMGVPINQSFWRLGFSRKPSMKLGVALFSESSIWWPARKPRSKGRYGSRYESLQFKAYSQKVIGNDMLGWMVGEWNASLKCLKGWRWLDDIGWYWIKNITKGLTTSKNLSKSEILSKTTQRDTGPFTNFWIIWDPNPRKIRND